MTLRYILSVFLTSFIAGLPIWAQTSDPITNPLLISPPELVPGTTHPVVFSSDTSSRNVRLLGSWLLSTRNGNAAIHGYADDSGEFALLAQPDLGLIIFNVSDKTQPRLHAVLSRSEQRMRDVIVTDRYAICAQEKGPLLVVDLNEPAAPELIAEYAETFTSAHKLTQAGDWIVVLSSGQSEDSGNAHLLDFSDPASPAEVATIAGAEFRSAVYDSSILWLSATRRDSVLAYDISDTGDIRLVGGFSFPAPTEMTLTATGETLFVASDSLGHGVGVFSISRPARAERITTIADDLATVFHALSVRNGFLYAAGKENLVRIFDVAAPAAPWEAAYFIEKDRAATIAQEEQKMIDGGVGVYLLPGGRSAYISDSRRGLLVFSYDRPELQIRDVRDEEVEYTSFRVRWSTTMPTTGRVEVTDSTGAQVALVSSSNPGRQHSVMVRGLQPGTSYDYVVFAESARDELVQSDVFTTTTLPFAGELIRVNAGGSGLDVNGALWQADREYDGAQYGYVGGHELSIRTPIEGGVPAGLYGSARLGMESYHFPLKSNGRYRATFHFAEVEGRAPGMRVFDIYLEDSLAIEGVDIAARAGINTAMRASAEIEVTDGELDIRFVPKNGEPMVVAIEVLQILPDQKPPTIMSLTVESVSTNSAVISWTTDEFAETHVEYGINGLYDNTAVATLGGGPFAYRAGIEGLQPGTRYDFRIVAVDSLGNRAERDGGFFQTSLNTTLSFTDITSSAGTGGPTYFRRTGGHSANFTDVNGDTRPDLYITMLRDDPMDDLFFRNIDGKTFADEAALRGITDFDGGSHGAVFADLDNDGDFDLFNGATDSTETISGRNNVYINDGNGFFEDMSEKLGLPDRSWETRGVAAFDMDNDDDLDLIAVTNYLGTDDPPGEKNELYRNELSESGRLKFTTIDTGIVVDGPLAQGVTDADFDGDGDVDLLVANRTGPFSILRNEGGGAFVLIDPTDLGITHRAEDGITAGDIDNDGDLDLLLATDNLGHLYRNDGGRYVWLRSFEETDGYMAAFADLDNDTDLDLVFAGDDIIWINAGGGYFVPGPPTFVGEVKDPRAIAMADIDGDGDLDFAVACKRSPNVLIRNNLDTGNWLKVRLVSAAGQAGAFGAKVHVYPAGQGDEAGGVLVGFREAHGVNGYLGQDDPLLHFGLGTYERVDVRVTFIDGSLAWRRDVAANQTILINGPDADTAAPIISHLRVSRISAYSAELRWQTNEPALPGVRYRDALGKPVRLGGEVLGREHVMRLVNLQPGTRYEVTVESEDSLGNRRSIPSVSFTTGAPPPPVPQYDVFELGFRSDSMPAEPAANPPALEVEFTGTSGDAVGQRYSLSGFWNGGDSLLVRFAPPEQGEWNWVVRSDLNDLDGRQGFFLCSGTLPEGHISRRGFIRENPEAPYGFAHADGTPFFLLGDTQWSFSTSAISWPDEFKAYVAARSRQGFNYVHGVVYQTFPAGNDRNEGGQTFFDNDPDRLNPAFWQAFDQRVRWLNEQGLVAGLMLAWASDGWQDFQTREQVERYVRYITARYAAYNVIWILAGEIEEADIPGGYANAAAVLRAADPYDHPLTTHTIFSSADSPENLAWQSTIYQQTGITGLIRRDRVHSRPVINSEFGYEGNISSEDVRRRAWEIAMSGGFVVFGNRKTYHYQAEMTPENLDSPAALFMQKFGTFWKGESGPQPRWWRYALFDSLAPGRYQAGIAGEEMVFYLEDPAPLILAVADSVPQVNITWFDTRSGEERREQRTPVNGALVLTPPDSAWAALVRFRDEEPPAFGEVMFDMIDGFTVRARWTTSEPARAFVRFGRDSTCSLTVPVDSVYSTEHAVLLQNLDQGTDYHLCLRVEDIAGNSSETRARFRTIVSDSSAWFFRNVRVDSITSASAFFSWMTPEPMTSVIAIGTDSTTLRPVLSSNTLKTEHRFRVDNLADSTRFFYRLSGKDSSGAGLTSSVGDFLTRYDRIPPSLEAVTVQAISPDSVLILFTASELTTSQLFYREVSEMQDREQALAELVREHRYVLGDIRQKTRYRYVIRLRDRRGNVFQSQPAYFSTDSLALQPFSIVLQAEDMAEKRGGTSVENESAWYFSGQGMLRAAVAVPANGIYRITVRAKGQNSSSQGWPVLQFGVDDRVVQHIPVRNESYREIQLLGRMTAGENTIRLANYLRGAESDYGEVWIDWIKIASIDRLPAPAAPQIFDIVIGEPEAEAMPLRWQTNVPTWAQVHYGLRQPPSAVYVVDSLSFEHRIRLSNLLPDTVYHLQITAVDSLGFTSVQDVELRTIGLTSAVPGDEIPTAFHV